MNREHLSAAVLVMGLSVAACGVHAVVKRDGFDTGARASDIETSTATTEGAAPRPKEIDPNRARTAAAAIIKAFMANDGSPIVR